MVGRQRRSDGDRALELSADRDDPAPRDGGPIEAASFISNAVTELAQLSQRHGLHMLSYLLGMAQMEADEQVQKRLGSGRF